MSLSPVALAQFVHPYYSASHEVDLDAAFADGKRRAIRVLEKRIDQVSKMVRADYERELCPNQMKENGA